MLLEEKHRQKAESNEVLAHAMNALASSLDCSEVFSRGWAAVVIFYSALHLVDAYLAHSGRKGGSHQQRADEIKRDVKLRKILTEYQFLSALSKTVRYDTNPLPANAYELAKPRLDAVKRHLDHVLQ